MSQTIIIESNREISYKEELESIKNSSINTGITDFPNNKWRQQLESGIQINPGDEISIEACMVNTKGSPEETMEFSGSENESVYDLPDNECNMTFEYYITNNQQFNFNLPLQTTVVKKSSSDATENDFGAIDFSTYDNFKKAYPFEKIELTNTCQNSPFPICRANETRMYLMNTNLDDTDEKTYRGWEINDDRTIDLFNNEISFKIDKGFNTPSNIGESITQQFHNRIGDASEWVNLLTNGSNFFIENNNLFELENPLITNNSFLSVVTSTGDIFKKFKIGQ